MKKTGLHLRAAYKKKYAVVSKDGYLYVYRSKSQDVRELKINLLTSDVRQSSDKKFIHLITVERNKPYTLMAENANLTQRWVSVIANARQSQLKRVFEDDSTNKLNPANRSESQTAITDLTKSVICEIQKLPGNNICADCRKPNPDWLSVNLGILVCLNCSGLHRKLGVNYSKIQSIELDNLGTASLLIARKVGNELFNEAYEGTDTGTDKPNAESSQMMRDNFITRKYIDKAYVQRTAHHKDLAKGQHWG